MEKPAYKHEFLECGCERVNDDYVFKCEKHAKSGTVVDSVVVHTIIIEEFVDRG